MTATPTTRTLGLDTWMTPSEIFDPVHALFRFTGDACAGSAAEARLPAFISPEQDALSTDWSVVGPRVWCNCPYGRSISAWFHRADAMVRGASVDTVVMLTFANTDTGYWREYVAENEHCHAVVFLHRRVRFVRPDGVKSGAAPKGSALIVYAWHRRATRWPVHLYADATSPESLLSCGLREVVGSVFLDKDSDI